MTATFMCALCVGAVGESRPTRRFQSPSAIARQPENYGSAGLRVSKREQDEQGYLTRKSSRILGRASKTADARIQRWRTFKQGSKDRKPKTQRTLRFQGPLGGQVIILSFVTPMTPKGLHSNG